MKPGKLFFRLTAPLGVAVIMMLSQLSAHAGIFSVSPVRIYMAPKDRAVAVTLANEGDSEITLQADIYSWTQQPDGKDDLVLTEDLLMSPPIIKLAPKGRQVVRLAMLAPRDASRQMTYRMILREVPQNVPAKDKIQVPIALALNMPVFVTPPIAKSDVACSVKRTDADKLQAICSNTGTAYAQIREVLLKRGDLQLARFEGGEYLLPGASKTLPLKTKQATESGTAELSVTFDDGKSQTATVTLP